jgi:serine/threonine-protein kinase HipA
MFWDVVCRTNHSRNGKEPRAKKRRRKKVMAKSRGEQIWVWLDDPEYGPLQQIGTLSRGDRGSVRFSYEPGWLKHAHAFSLDPELDLTAGEFFPGDSNFGVFMDSCPDRWGQILMKRREAVEAKEEGRTPRTLGPWEFLLGVQDCTRMGALRFSRPGEQVFLADEALSAPPMTRIAKFPSADDDYDVALWENLLQDLAQRCGITVPDARVLQIGDGYHTFLGKRFDRHGGNRRFFASAMTMIGHGDTEDASYLELAEFLATYGEADSIASDLEELFTRVAFNVATANRDDHLRNHGFIRSPFGWRLAPAFDMNPSFKKEEHVLSLDLYNRQPDMGVVLSTAGFYRLASIRAQKIIVEVCAAVGGWQTRARKLGLSRQECAEADHLFCSASS